MFPDELIQILEKYKEEMWLSHVENLNKNFKQTISLLKGLRNYLADKLYDIYTSDSLDDSADCDVLSSDISLLKQQILYYIKLQEATQVNCDFKTETSKELMSLPIYFEEYTHIHLCCENVCPKCIEKLNPISIYYQRKIENVINRESVPGYRCPVCGSLYMIDSDFEKMDRNNTNIEIHTKRYNKLSIQDEVYVVTDVNKCSANGHDLDDILGTIPIIDNNGKTAFTYVDIIHCKTCHKYIMLKSTYQNIKDFLACQVIDETKEAINRTNNSISDYDSTGSKLSQLGYNVNCVDKLTEKQRETLLVAIISAKLLTQGEIIGNIDRNINNGLKRVDSKKDWSNAVAKWEHDKKFIQSFDIEKSDNDINIGKIILKYKKN